MVGLPERGPSNPSKSGPLTLGHSRVLWRRYTKALGSIFPTGDCTGNLREGDPKDVLILEEPEHLCWFHSGQRLWLRSLVLLFFGPAKRAVGPSDPLLGQVAEPVPARHWRGSHQLLRLPQHQQCRGGVDRWEPAPRVQGEVRKPQLI